MRNEKVTMVGVSVKYLGEGAASGKKFFFFYKIKRIVLWF